MLSGVELEKTRSINTPRILQFIDKNIICDFETGKLNLNCLDSSNGYRYCQIGRYYYPVHHIVYYIKTGKSGVRLKHIDGIKHNNAFSNLQLTNYKQAVADGQERIQVEGNISIYRGVSFNSVTSNYHAHLRFQKRLFHLGESKIEKECARMYDIGALTYHDSRAKLNFPISDYVFEDSKWRLNV